MKRNTITAMAIMLGMLMFAVPAMAATTASLSPASVKVATGQQFNVAITVNPQGTENYAEKLEIDYPAGTLEATSFTLSNGWMALTQPGYDSIDNANGVLIKTAGYGGGLSSPTAFGTILFTAKKSGSGIIKIGNTSSAFQVSSQSPITGSGTSFTVSVAKAVPTNTTTTGLAPITSINGQVIEPTSTTPITVVATTSSQLAAAAVAGSSSYTWLWILLIVVVLALIGWLIYGRKPNKKL